MVNGLQSTFLGVRRLLAGAFSINVRKRFPNFILCIIKSGLFYLWKFLFSMLKQGQSYFFSTFWNWWICFFILSTKREYIFRTKSWTSWLKCRGFFSFSFNSASTTQAALGEQLGLSLWYQHSNVECESSKFNGMKNEVF